MGGEELRVDRSEVRPVREAEVRELRLPKGRPELVHVDRDVDRAHVLEQQPRRVGGARVRRTLRGGHDLIDLRLVAGAGGLRLSSWRICARDTHVTGSLRATPRGSKLTRLNVDLREAGNPFAFCSRKSTPEPPGPPGFVTMSPSAGPGPLAGRQDQGEGEASRARVRVGDRDLQGAALEPPTDVTAPAASEVQVVQTIGAGFGSEEGVVRGVVIGSVVSDAGEVVLDPDRCRTAATRRMETTWNARR